MTLVKRDRNRRPKRKVCSFCADKIEHIDYKDVAKLRRFITHQRQVTVAIKRARNIALLPFTAE